MENSADALKGQTIRVECNGTSQQISIDYGDFDVVLSVPQSKEPPKGSDRTDVGSPTY